MDGERERALDSALVALMRMEKIVVNEVVMTFEECDDRYGVINRGDENVWHWMVELGDRHAKADDVIQIASDLYALDSDDEGDDGDDDKGECGGGNVVYGFVECYTLMRLCIHKHFKERLNKDGHVVGMVV